MIHGGFAPGRLGACTGNDHRCIVWEHVRDKRDGESPVASPCICSGGHNVRGGLGDWGSDWVWPGLSLIRHAHIRAARCVTSSWSTYPFTRALIQAHDCHRITAALQTSRPLLHSLTHTSAHTYPPQPLTTSAANKCIKSVLWPQVASRASSRRWRTNQGANYWSH